MPVSMLMHSYPIYRLCMCLGGQAMQQCHDLAGLWLCCIQSISQHIASCFPAFAGAPGLPAVLSRLQGLVVGDTCTLSYVDDSLLVLLAKHASSLTALDCSGETGGGAGQTE
jgi:hypothetical protein